MFFGDYRRLLNNKVEVLCEKLLRGVMEIGLALAAPGKGLVGVHGAGETPVPIPNTAVKPGIGYNTWVLALGK